jgi:hypothetical protein
MHRLGARLRWIRIVTFLPRSLFMFWNSVLQVWGTTDMWAPRLTGPTCQPLNCRAGHVRGSPPMSTMCPAPVAVRTRAGSLSVQDHMSRQSQSSCNSCFLSFSLYIHLFNSVSIQWMKVMEVQLSPQWIVVQVHAWGQCVVFTLSITSHSFVVYIVYAYELWYVYGYM